MPLRRVLVANRGEIARRVIRACHDEGVEAVAVYSDADAGARFLDNADESLLIGAGPPSQSYLDWVREGTTVSHLYDPLIAKLVAHAATRPQAIDRALSALHDYSIEGVTTNLALHRHALQSAAFRSGDYTTQILQEIGAPPEPAPVG